MRFTSIRCTSEKVEIAWRARNEHYLRTTTMTSDDKPHPGFTKAMEALAPQVAKLIGAQREYVDDVDVRSVAISYQKDDRRGFVISATKPVRLTNGPFNISTPLIYEPDLDTDGGGQASQDLMELLEDVIEQARLFVDGRREQVELFEHAETAPQPDEAAIAAAREREIDNVIGYLVGSPPVGFEEWSDEGVIRDVIDSFDERLEGKELASFSIPTIAGTGRIRCGISASGGVPRYWHDVRGKLNPDSTPATLMGSALAAVVRRVWQAQQGDQQDLELAGEQPAQDPEAWAHALRPSPAPTGEVTTEVVAQCLHSALFAVPGGAAGWMAAHEVGSTDDEIINDLLVSFDAHGGGKEKYSWSEAIGIKSSENVKYVAVDVVLEPLTMKVQLTTRKKQKLNAAQLVDVVRGMLDIGDPTISSYCDGEWHDQCEGCACSCHTSNEADTEPAEIEEAMPV